MTQVRLVLSGWKRVTKQNLFLCHGLRYPLSNTSAPECDLFTAHKQLPPNSSNLADKIITGQSHTNKRGFAPIKVARRVSKFPWYFSMFLLRTATSIRSYTALNTRTWRKLKAFLCNLANVIHQQRHWYARQQEQCRWFTDS